jgi:hypothetical protein
LRGRGVSGEDWASPRRSTSWASRISVASHGRDSFG